MNVSDYYHLVRETLDKEWGKYPHPLRAHENDVTVAVGLLAQIACHKAMQECVHPTWELSSDPEWANEFTNKIKAFVARNESVFRNVCEKKRPFPILENFDVGRSLKNHDSRRVDFLNSISEEMSEEQLHHCFENIFHLENDEIGSSCVDCINALRSHAPSTIQTLAYDLLGFLKKGMEYRYDLPEKELLKIADISQILIPIFTQELKNLTNPVKAIDILFYQKSRFEEPLYKSLFSLFEIEQAVEQSFFNFVIGQLKTIGSHQWPKKSNIIALFIEHAVPATRIKIAKALAVSHDENTAKIGNHLLVVLTASSFAASIPSLLELRKMIPCVKNIFSYPSIDFLVSKSLYAHDTKLIKRVNFHKGSAVTSETIMVGVDRRLGYLLAYDMHTEKSIWGIPLKSERYYLRQFGDSIALQLLGDNKAYIIQSQTGDFLSIIEMPRVPHDVCDDLHLSSEGFAYQLVRVNLKRSQKSVRLLICGKIAEEKWLTIFIGKTPSGSFQALSTHCGFYNKIKKQFTVYGPLGDHVTLNHCLGAQAVADKLYVIEEDPSREDQAFFTVKRLLPNSAVLSENEMRLTIDIKGISGEKRCLSFFPPPQGGNSLTNLCQNGTFILFSNHSTPLLSPDRASFPIFIDIRSLEIIYGHYFYSLNEKSFIISKSSGEIWSWNSHSKQIKKSSSTGIEVMAVLNREKEINFLHVDQGNHLYLYPDC